MQPTGSRSIGDQTLVSCIKNNCCVLSVLAAVILGGGPHYTGCK